MSDDSVIDFGKFAGHTYAQMYKKKWYVKWVYEQDCNGKLEELRDYFESKDTEVALKNYNNYLKCQFPKTAVKPMFLTPATSQTPQ